MRNVTRVKRLKSKMKAEAQVIHQIKLIRKPVLRAQTSDKAAQLCCLKQSYDLSSV